MMKIYLCPDGLTRQYEEGKQPKGAVEVVKSGTKAKTTPTNKSRHPAKDK